MGHPLVRSFPLMSLGLGTQRPPSPDAVLAQCVHSALPDTLQCQKRAPPEAGSVFCCIICAFTNFPREWIDCGTGGRTGLRVCREGGRSILKSPSPRAMGQHAVIHLALQKNTQIPPHNILSAIQSEKKLRAAHETGEDVRESDMAMSWPPSLHLQHVSFFWGGVLRFCSATVLPAPHQILEALSFDTHRY